MDTVYYIGPKIGRALKPGRVYKVHRRDFDWLQVICPVDGHMYFTWSLGEHFVSITEIESISMAFGMEWDTVVRHLRENRWRP